MNADLIEICLDRLTDSLQFEKLANEIMQDEGFSNIIPLGGVKDKGRDAIEENFWISEGKVTTVFQYTMQEYLIGKLHETVEKLRNNNVGFSEIVLVTPKAITVERQDNLKSEARKQYSLPLQIFERKTILLRLSKLNNGIFYRHFSGISEQLKSLLTKPKGISQDISGQFENAMLMSSIVLTFGKGAKRVRNNIFDHMILGLMLSDYPDWVNVNKLSSTISSHLSISVSNGQILASIKRLKSKSLIDSKNSKHRASQLACNSVEIATIKANESINSLIADILDSVSNNHSRSISKNRINIVARNARAAFLELFRLMGLELCNRVQLDSSPSPLFHENLNAIISLVNRDLPDDLGSVLNDVLAEIIQNPSDDQARIIANWSSSFIGIQIMNLDPTLREFQATRLQKKIFILDTDFILDCIVTECPISNTYNKLVEALLECGCNVIVPEVAVDECNTHAYFAGRTYNAVRDSLFGYDPAYIDSMIGNVFVKGYYFACQRNNFTKNQTFDEYLSNYYDPKESLEFMTEVIVNTLPKGVQLKNPTKLLEVKIPDDKFQKMTTEILKLLLKHSKAAYRDAKENRALAETDARLFLTALYLNGQNYKPTENILGGKAYLITQSSRCLKCSRTVGIRDEVTTRPQSLINLLDLILGQEKLTPPQLMQLFENPFLNHAMNQCRDDIRYLAESGLLLSGRSLSRLRRDLREVLHSQIASLGDSSQIDQKEKTEQEFDDTDSFMEMFKIARERGYILAPSVEALIKELEESKEREIRTEVELEAVKATFEKVKDKFSEFSKRKQKFLKRLARRSESKKP